MFRSAYLFLLNKIVCGKLQDIVNQEIQKLEINMRAQQEYVALR